MSQNQYHDERVECVLHPASEIGARVQELAAEIAADYAGCPMLHVVGVLKGAFVFMSDLVRGIQTSDGPPVCIDFVRASTYGAGVKEAGEASRSVSLELLPDGLAGCDVILVEDILDQGFTLSHIVDVLENQVGVRSVSLCVLLVKHLAEPSAEVDDLRRRLLTTHKVYAGFEIPDRWVAGYGLDVGEQFREFPDVVIVNEELFQA